MTETYRLAITCTDSGQHAWIALGDLVLTTANGQIEANNGMAYGERADRRKSECVWIDDRGNVHLQCPRCRRNVPWRPENARRAIAGLWELEHSGGVASIDISLLP